MKLINLAFLLCATLAIACGGGTKSGTTTPANGSGAGAGPNGDQPPPPADERLMLMFEQLSTELVTAGTDCNKYAQYVSTWTTSNGARYSQLHTEAKALDLAKDRLDLVNKRLETSLASVVKGYSRCRNNADAAKAYKAFDALIERD